MNMYSKLICTIIFSIAATNTIAEEFRINGATTVLDRVVDPYKGDVESMTGYKIKVLGHSTGRGLADLIDGKCEASMVSEPMDIAMAAANKTGKEIDQKNLVFSVVMMDEIVFVTHPSNPVKSLSLAQIKDIHQGKIKNWKQLGGNDLEIDVYADAATGGTRAMIRKIVLQGEDFGDNVSTEHSVKKAASRVSKSEGGIAGVGLGFAHEYPLQILNTTKIERPLGFVTIGQPSSKMDQIISAFKTAAAKGAKDNKAKH